MSSVIDKCSLCMLRYICEDEAEFHCKTHNFIGFALDSHSPYFKPKTRKVKVRIVKQKTKKEATMYTVKELIETLKECPEDYEVQVIKGSAGYRISHTYEIKTVGIDFNEKTVDLFID